jgi:hypothetical protein
MGFYHNATPTFPNVRSFGILASWGVTCVTLGGDERHLAL